MGFGERIQQAQQRELLTAEQAFSLSRQREQADAAGTVNANNEARMALKGIWLAVTEAIATKNPPEDAQVVDHAGIEAIKTVNAELFRHKPPRKNRHIVRADAQRIRVADSHAQPAWDMIEGILLPGYGDSRDLCERNMYLGRDGTIYNNIGRHQDRLRTPGGTVYLGLGWEEKTFSPGFDFSNMYVYGSWNFPQDYVRLCHESIEQGLANLVAKHSLDVGV
jgi:hypothetical protein